MTFVAHTTMFSLSATYYCSSMHFAFGVGYACCLPTVAPVRRVAGIYRGLVSDAITAIT